MITNLYDRYFQKSRSFLFPALGIRKIDINPAQTFIGLNDFIKPNERKLICLFEHSDTLKYEEFENNLLFGNPLYHDSEINPGQSSIYIFNFDAHKQDFDRFLQGKYSQLSPEFKLVIKNYYGEHTPEYAYMETYLFPEKFFDLYSELLDVNKKIVMTSGELCNIYDQEKETLVFSTIKLEKSLEMS